MKFSNTIVAAASLVTFYSQAVEARAIIDNDLILRDVANNA